MASIPTDWLPDSTLSLLRDPYRFISKRCRKHGTDVFQTRLLLQKTICMTGAEAAELFYDETRFRRQGAAPGRLQATLFGKGGVQGFDGDAHRHRKALFMELTTPDRVARLADRFAAEWRRAAGRWHVEGTTVLYEAVREVITRAVCAWAGVPLRDEDVDQRTRQLASMYEHAANVGPRHWRGRHDRRDAEAWIGQLVREIRRGGAAVAGDAAAGRIARHRDPDGELLDEHAAAVEIINVLRPTVAVAVYVTLLAHALHRHPEHRTRVDDDRRCEELVQEVRRFYPFFPFVAAIVREDFEWHGHRFEAGARALLDLYGIDHDPRIWREPEQFRPERFHRGDPGPFGFVPQGGGDPHVHHRCPGEPIAIELMKVAARFLAGGMHYTVPDQDLELDFGRMPALPASGFVIEDVELADEPTRASNPA